MRSVWIPCIACAAGLAAITGIAATSNVPRAGDTPATPAHPAAVPAVDSMQEAPKAAAPTTPGTNKLTDSELATKVTTQLRAAKGLDSSRIKVNARNGVVELAGNVKSDSDRLTALNTAKSVSGVSMVEDNITVGK